MAKTTWDAWVVLANDPLNVVSYIPRWKTIEFSDQLNDVGSGSLSHDLSDPFFEAFETQNGNSLLTGPYSIKIVRDGQPVFRLTAPA
jgi:hypothetical protein